MSLLDREWSPVIAMLSIFGIIVFLTIYFTMMEVKEDRKFCNERGLSNDCNVKKVECQEECLEFNFDFYKYRNLDCWCLNNGVPYQIY